MSFSRKWFIIILLTIFPFILLIILHYTTQQSIIRVYDLNRKYKRPLLKKVEYRNLDSVYDIKFFRGKIYSSNFHQIFTVNSSFRKIKNISNYSPIPIIGWGFTNNKLIVSLANTKTLFFVSNNGDYIPLVKLKTVVQKIYFCNDSLILISSLDSSYVHSIFYLYNLNTSRLIKLNISCSKMVGGGIVCDGSVILDKTKVIYYLYHLGKFYVFDLTNQNKIHVSTYQTIDRDNIPNGIIRFSKSGFRMDKKQTLLNLCGFYFDNYVFICSNAYNRNELKSSYYFNRYFLDAYDDSLFYYKFSYSIEKGDDLGNLIFLYIYNNKLYSIYLHKIVIYDI